MTAGLQSALSVDRPFPGLRPYAFEDSQFYFGREDQIYSLYRLLDRSRFVAVVGSSGSGKSSLVRAGLSPLLDAETKQAGGRSWRWVEMRPGDAPLSSLSGALAKLLPKAEDDVGRAVNAARRERIGFALRQSSFGLVEALDKIEGLGESSFVLVVDQFEELFRYAAPAASHRSGPGAETLWRDDAAHFVQLLLEISRDRTRAVQVIITMRSDFIGDCARFHGLPEAVSATQFLVPSLTRDQREEVIRKPIEKAGATIEPTLVERLLNDGGDELDQLPVVQHCLMRLWEHAGSDAASSASAGSGAHDAEAQPAATRHLTVEHYHAVGAIAGALSQHAEEVLASLPGLELAVEQVFRALAEIDREGRAIRRAVPFARLLAETGVPEDQLRKAVDRLRGEDCSFLVPPRSTVPELAPDTRIDVGHEALLRRWERLSGDPNLAGDGTSKVRTGWLRTEDTDGGIYRGLLAFVDSGSGRTTLPPDQVEQRWKWWRSSPRTEAWAQRYGGGFARVNRLFENSLAALAADREAARAAAAAKRRRTWVTIGCLAVGLLAALAFAGYALDLKQTADARRREADEAKTAALEQKQRASDALAAATQNANEMVIDLAGKFRRRIDMPVDLMVEILLSAQNQQRRLAELGPTTPDLRYGQAVALNQLADAYAEQGKDDEGVKAGEQARDILVDLLRVQPATTRWKQALADSYHRIGRAYRGNLCEGGLMAYGAERALTAYRAGLAMREELRAADPGTPDWQSLIAESHSAIGDTMLEANNREVALESYRAGLAVAKRLAADHPDDPQWQARLAVSSMEVAVALPGGQRAERLEILRNGVRGLQNAADAMPDNRQTQRDLSNGYAFLCTGLVETKEYEAALDAAQHGVEIVQGLLKLDPHNADWHRVSRSVYYSAKGVFVASGRDDKVRDIDEEVDALNKRRAAAGNDCGKK